MASTYNIEGVLYWGNATTPITHLSGASGRGIAIAHVQQKIVRLDTTVNPARVVLEIRDMDAANLRLIARDLMGESDTGVRGSGTSHKLPGQFARTCQFAVVPITTTLPMLYLPAAALEAGNDFRRWGFEAHEVQAIRADIVGGTEWAWGRGIEAQQGELVLRATCPRGQTTPPWVRDTAAVVASVYSLTA